MRPQFKPQLRQFDQIEIRKKIYSRMLLHFNFIFSLWKKVKFHITTGQSIFTADIPVTSNVIVATYADDTTIAASLYVQRYINLLEKCLTRWNIKVNPVKSRPITFALRRVTVFGVQIPKENEVKYLDITLDRRLTWKAKQTHLKLKTRTLYWLLGPKSELTLNNKMRIYKAIL